MKKVKLLTLIGVLFSNCVTAQVSIPANAGIATDYVGWDNTNGFRLPIKHEGTWPIDFFTSAGFNAFNNQRMTIFEDNVLSPNSSLYNVGRVGIREDGTRWNFDPIPASLLHLGHGWPIGAGGHRAWMDVGTFTTAGTDMTYFGLKQQSNGTEEFPWTDHMDAVINWGDNQVGPDNFNDLRFIFTIPSGVGGEASSNEGLEVARMAWNGFVGIGSFRHPTNMMTPTRPARRLEVIDRGVDPNNSLPQLRLTLEPQNDPLGGIDPRFTDFETSVRGDLLIYPTRGSNARRIGVNMTTPLATIDIRGINAGTLPQLRLTHSPTGAGTWTDFHTTSAGNLVIRPTVNSSGSTVEKNVGINVAVPAAKVHIKGDTGIPNFRITNSATLNMMNVEDNGSFTFRSDISNGSVGAYNFLTTPTLPSPTSGLGLVSECITNGSNSGSNQAGAIIANDAANTGNNISTIIGVSGEARSSHTNGNATSVRC